MNPFRGEHGVRAGWRLLAFLLVMNLSLTGVQWFVIRVLKVEHIDFRPGPLLLAEAISLAFALMATMVMARWERRTLGQYGLPLREAFGAQFREGALWGLAANLLVIGLITACGGYSVSGLAVHGTRLVTATLLWLAAFLGVALYEEIYFRGYPGWHFTWNWSSMGVFGSPNTGNEGRPLPDHLLAGTFHGPQYLTGGGMGAEASLWMLPMLALLFWLFHRRHPDGGVEWPQA